MLLLEASRRVIGPALPVIGEAAGCESWIQVQNVGAAQLVPQP